MGMEHGEKKSKTKFKIGSIPGILLSSKLHERCLMVYLSDKFTTVLLT